MTKDEARVVVKEMMQDIWKLNQMITTKPVHTGWLSHDRLKAMLMLWDELIEEDKSVVHYMTQYHAQLQAQAAQSQYNQLSGLAAQQQALQQNQAIGQGIVNSGISGIGGLGSILGGIVGGPYGGGKV